MHFAKTMPSHTHEVKVSFPEEHILLLTLNRPKSLNAMTPGMKEDLDEIMEWFDNEPELWVVVITGEGRAFCAGADLKAWSERKQAGEGDEGERVRADTHGFGSISRRSITSKPIIAAVNGFAYGGGTEIVLNCDLVIAADDAVFALPEIKRGVVAIQGGIPRLARIAGHQLASEMLLLGRPTSALEAATRFGFVNKVVPKANVLGTALAWAVDIVQSSPDSVQSTKRALLLTNQLAHVEDIVAEHTQSKESRRHGSGYNMKEGLKAWIERRRPVWRSPAKL